MAGLVALSYRGNSDQIINRYLAPFLAEDIDTLVLGCTSSLSKRSVPLGRRWARQPS